MKYFKYINYSRQSINSSDIKNVSQSLRDEFLTQGNKIIKFETNLRNFFKCKYSLAVSNGTAALFLSLKALNLKKNDSIIISPFTFVAAVNCCKLLNLKEKFIDIDPLTLNIDLNLVEKEIKKKKYKAIIVTDYGGLPADWERLNFIRKKYNISIINDNCHSLGSKYKNDLGYATKYADLVVQSFHPVKTITTGEGGCILTNNKKIYTKAKLLRSHGIVKNKRKYWDYDVLESSLNFRISDIQCALGITQLSRAKYKILKKRSIAKKYDNFFKKYNFFSTPLNNKKFYNSYHLYPLVIDFNKLEKKKDDLIYFFYKNKIRLQVHYVPSYRFTIFKKWKSKNFPNCEKIFKNIISIPIFDELTNSELNKIIKLFKKFFNLK